MKRFVLIFLFLGIGSLSSMAQILEGKWRTVRVEYQDEQGKWQTLSTCSMSPGLDRWDGEKWTMILDESDLSKGSFEMGEYEESITDIYESASTKMTVLNGGYLSIICPVTQSEVVYRIEGIYCFSGDCNQFALQEIFEKTFKRADFRYVFERAGK